MNVLDKMPELDLDTRPFEAQMEEAADFFLVPEVNNLKNAADPYRNKDGMVQFICVAGSVRESKQTELKSTLIKLVSIVTAYVNRYADAYGPQYRTDINLWAKAVSQLPLVGDGTMADRKYDRETEGVNIPNDIVKLVLDIVPEEGLDLRGFRSFLQTQGEFLRRGIEENGGIYKTIIVCPVVEVSKVGNEVIYMPRIKLYMVTFTRNNSGWTLVCGSTQKVKMQFDYLYTVNNFNFQALSNPSTKKQLDEFVQRIQKANIDESSTFFDSEFTVKA